MGRVGKDETPDVATDQVSGELLEIWTEYEGFIDDVLHFMKRLKLPVQVKKLFMKKCN